LVTTWHEIDRDQTPAEVTARTFRDVKLVAAFYGRGA